MVLGALLLVSVVPISLYHRQVLKLSQEKLVDTERVQQTELTRSLAGEIQLFESNLTQQLLAERQIMALSDLIQDVDDPVREPKVTRLLENFVDSNPDILYLTAVGIKAKGTAASRPDFRAEQDPFVSKALQRAFATCVQAQALKFRSDPLALAPDNRPAFIIAVPLKSEDQFTGMLAAVASLKAIVRRLVETSVRGRSVYVVDHYGHIVAHHDTRIVPGTDDSASPVVAKIRSLSPEFRATETTQFELPDNNRTIEMIGTYTTFPEVNWAVIAQRSLEQAREDAGVTELNTQAFAFVSVATMVALFLGYFFAVGISTPIRGLANSTSARRSAAPPKSAISRRPLTRWLGTSRKRLSSSRKPPKKTTSSSLAPSACSPRRSTKRIPIREAIPGACQVLPPHSPATRPFHRGSRQNPHRRAPARCR